MLENLSIKRTKISFGIANYPAQGIMASTCDSQTDQKLLISILMQHIARAIIVNDFF